MPEPMNLNIILFSPKWGTFQGYLSQMQDFWAAVRFMGTVKYDLKDITYWMPMPTKPIKK